MRGINWLKRLWVNERGNVLVLGAVTLPLLMGSAGLAVDSIQATLWKRQLQRAADSASIAGARAISQGASTDTAVANDLDEHIDYDLEENETPVITNREVTTGSFDAGAMSGDTCAARGGSVNCHDDAVQIVLETERRLPFMGLFTDAATKVNARATAAIVDDGEFCLVSLYDGTDPGITALGNPSLELKCGIATNSRATNALNVDGSAQIDATSVSAVGGIEGGGHYVGDAVLQPYSSAISDPFAGVPDPVLPAGCNTGTLSITAGTATAPVTIPNNACYASYNITGYARIATGGRIYVNNGDIDIKGSLVGTNTTLIMMGDDSSWTQNGGGKLSLTAPLTGDYAGIVIFRERVADSPGGKEIKINGGADLNLQGAIYGKNTDFWIGGNGAIDSQCIQIVGRKLEFKGGGTIHNNCQNTGTTSITSRRIRLVG